MKKIFLALTTCVCLILNTNAQTTKAKKSHHSSPQFNIPAAIVKDFAYHINYSIQNGNQGVGVLLYDHFKRNSYSIEQADLILENLDKDPKGFVFVLKAFWDISNNSDYLYRCIKGTGVSATTASYLTAYCNTHFDTNKKN